MYHRLSYKSTESSMVLDQAETVQKNRYASGDLLIAEKLTVRFDHDSSELHSTFNIAQLNPIGLDGWI